MAFTPEQERALLALLDEPLVTLNELPQTGQINDSDLFLTRQETVEKAATGEVLKDYVLEAASKDFQPLNTTLTALASLVTGANKLPYFTGAGTTGQTDLTQVGRDIIGKQSVGEVLMQLGLGNAAKRDIGTDSGQIPDMSSHTWGAGWVKLPSGYIIQFGSCMGGLGWPVTYYPIPFPNRLSMTPLLTHRGLSTQVIGVVNQDNQSLTSFNVGTNWSHDVWFSWIAIGF